MKRLAATLLLFVASTHADGPAPPDTSAVRALDFATLTAPEARRLDGREALFRVTLDGDSDTEDRDGFTCADCVGDDEPLRSLYLCPGQEAAESMTVKATLRIWSYPALVGADGSRLGALREYRLVAAVRQPF
jgi:hypothetical protein